MVVVVVVIVVVLFVGPASALAWRLRSDPLATGRGGAAHGPECPRSTQDGQPLGSMRPTITVMWQVRLLIALARPRARGRNRLSVGPSSAKQAAT